MGELLKLYKEEKTFQDTTSNQSNHHVRTDEFFQFLEQPSYDRFVDISKTIFLKEDGKAHIIFDMKKLNRYTVAIGNDNEQEIVYTVSYSPNGDMYKQFGTKKKVAAHTLDVIKSDSLLRFLRITISGSSYLPVTIFLQATKW